MNSLMTLHFGNQSHTKNDWMRWSKSEKNTIHGDTMLSKDFKKFIELLNENSLLTNGLLVVHRILLMQKILNDKLLEGLKVKNQTSGR